MPESQQQQQQQQDPGTWILACAGIFLVLAVAMLAINLVVLSHNQSTLAQEARDAVLTRQGVCQFRTNLQQQVVQGEHYLVLHPNGAPALGLSAAYIQSGIDKQKAAVTALSALNCG